MPFIYNQKRSEIFELTMLPVLSYSMKEWEWDFTQKELSLLAKDLNTLEEIYQLFLPFQAKIREYHLMGAGASFLTVCYFYLINQDKEPSDIEELHELVLAMTEKELEVCLHHFVEEDNLGNTSGMDFWKILNELSLKPEDKWQIFSFSHNLKENIKKTVEISRVLIDLYQPYFEKARAERESFAQTIKPEQLLEEAKFLQLENFSISSEDFELYIISPWMIRLSLISYVKKFGEYRNFLILSCKIDEVLLSHNELDEDNFSAVLKILSDLSRYKVLVALTQPHAKSKDIAESLGITSAAVSFHRQKLQNAQLLLFNSDEKDVKYDPNRELIQVVIDKLKEDFDL